MPSSAQEAALWLRSFRRGSTAQLRLICLPHAGGAATFFRDWVEYCPAEVELLAVQYPGRQNRLQEPFVESLHALADCVTEAILALCTGELALLGHSLGAAVAYEVARRLEQRGTSVRGLFVSGRPGPEYDRGGATHESPEEVLLADLARLGGTDLSTFTATELRDIVLPAIRNDYRLSETYEALPGPPLNCPVTALFGFDDPEVTMEEARGWRQVTQGVFRMRSFPGQHFYLQQHTSQVLRFVLQSLQVHGNLTPRWPSTP